MNTFLTTSRLSKPQGRKRISDANLAYLQTRNRLRLFSLVNEEFQKSGLSQADLAARLGKGTDRICKLLGAPGNWTLDTASDLIFAITGGTLKYMVSHPLDKAKRNDTRPTWVCEQHITSKPAVELKLNKQSEVPKTKIVPSGNTATWEAAV